MSLPSTVVLFTFFALIATTSGHDNAHTCGWGLPRNPLAHTPGCPAPFLDPSAPANPAAWAPWTHPPHCVTTPGPLSDSGPWCVFTNAALPHTIYPLGPIPAGISIIATPDLASSSLFDIGTRPLAGAFSALPRENLSHASPPPYEVRPVPGKGLGVFATRAIPSGKVILIDYVVLLAAVEYPDGMGKKQVRELMRVGVERLGDPQRLRGLARGAARNKVRGEELSPEEELLVTNAFELPMGEEELRYMGLFAELSRINHACDPNAHVHFSETTMAMTIWSAKDIQPGEEITISYSSIDLTSKERKETLQDTWGFKCSCSLCTAPKAVLKASDDRRLAFRAARDEVLQLAQDQDFYGAVEASKKLFELVDKEGLGPHLGDLYEIPARLHYQIGDLKNARKYFKRSMFEYYGWGVPGAKDSVSLQNAKGILARLDEEIAEREKQDKQNKKNNNKNDNGKTKKNKKRKPQVYLGKKT
ncbi:hypothetical protein B0T16DRAFT_492320 [Cercophora newfieldiana]|uniref:SET domain-containing protein n=1 Tax=Cercophora newfieldiana TaxID=92897 RepID=A0AA39YEX3_9PEZI|nr:hypothetical protein B0T16DRAFT_492320 [Cercophora newfieldiana]